MTGERLTDSPNNGKILVGIELQQDAQDFQDAQDAL
jgi:hypothetical protein